jgi:MFS transporter, FSR family, fosmidomycin resistance protein
LPNGGDVPRQRLIYFILVSSHLLVDLYPFFVFSLATTLRASLTLSEYQITLVQALSPIISGIVQPLFAWIGDRFNTRLFGPLGLLIGAVCIGGIGFATEFWQLLTLQLIGVAGIGFYHPIASAVAGNLGVKALRGVRFVRSSRGLGISLFFTAGMLGGFTGPILASRVNSYFGLEFIWILSIPGILGAAALWFAIRHIPHNNIRTKDQDEQHAAIDAISLRTRWFAVGLLFLSNSLRFTANVGLYKLYTLWAPIRFQGQSEQYIDARGSEIIAATTLGMAITGLLAGSFIHPGREKWPLFFSAFIAIPVVLLMPHVGYWPMLALASLSAIGHFSVIPLSIACAQRMLPHATGMVGSVLMGCGWVVSSLGPFIALYFVKNESFGLSWGFGAMAVLFAGAGLCSLLIPGRVLRATASVH